MIDIPLTTVNGDRTSNGGSMTNTEEYKDVLESSLRKIETRKKREMKRTQKMSEDLKRAKEENKNLKNKIDELMRQMNWNEEVLKYLQHIVHVHSCHVHVQDTLYLNIAQCTCTVWYLYYSL